MSKRGIVLALIVALFLAGCDDYSEETVTLEEGNIESSEATISETIGEESKESIKGQDVKKDEVSEVTSSKKESSDIHQDTRWKVTSYGPMTFEAPESWYKEPGNYSPGEQNEEFVDYYIWIDYYAELYVDDLIKYVKEDYDDVIVEDEDFGGLKGKYVEFTYEDTDYNDKEYIALRVAYYIQLNNGVFCLRYDAPNDKYEEFIDDYYRVVNSVELYDSQNNSSTKKFGHLGATWKETTIDPITFEAPSSWALETGFYYPHTGNNDGNGYYFSISVNDSKTVDSFAERDLEQYENVYIDEEEIDGHYAVVLVYSSQAIGENKMEYHITYYIDLFSGYGTGIVSYTAPHTAPNEYKEEFFRIVKSITIDEEQMEEEVPKTNYILNGSTGTFHKPSCYKVNQIDNPVSVESTRQEMLDKGYKGCKICDP